MTSLLSMSKKIKKAGMSIKSRKEEKHIPKCELSYRTYGKRS
jgi:hypothetical protein